MTEITARLLQLAYLMLPAYAANMAPPFVRFWKGWNRPIHAGLLGPHKTVVGFAVGMISAITVTGIQNLIASPLALVNYAHWPWLGLGFGAGAMAGDAIKSLLKRRRGIAPGAAWIPFDQLDFVIGSLLIVAPFAGLGIGDVMLVLGLSLVADIAVNRVAYRLHIKTSPW